MPTDMLLPLLIGTLTALSAGLLVFRAISRFAARRGPDVENSGKTLARRLAPWLEAVPVPMLLVNRWRSSGLDRQLIHAGVSWSVEAFLAFRYLLILAAGAISGGMVARWGSELLPAFLALAVLLAGVLLPKLILEIRIERRRALVDLALPDLLDRLTLGLEAGLGFEIALRRTADTFGGLLGTEIRRAVRKLDRGHPKYEAIEGLADRNPSQDLRAFAASVRQAERLGTSLSKTLKIQSRVLRAHRRRRAQEASRRLPILIVFPLVFFFLPALLIVYLAPPLLHLFLAR